MFSDWLEVVVEVDFSPLNVVGLVEIDSIVTELAAELTAENTMEGA